MRNLRILLVAVVLTCTLGAAAAHVVPVSLADAQQQTAERPTSTLVWQGDKVSIGNSVSPDGRYVSFIDWNTGSLWLHDLVTNADRMIVATNNVSGRAWKAGVERSTISRDGLHVAYSWFDDTKGYALWVANLRGDPKPHRLYGAENIAWIEPPDWSPDGKWIAAMIESKDFSRELTVVSVSTGAARILKTGYWPGNMRTFFSPDGKYLAYDLPQQSVNARDVWVTALDGTRDVRVVAHRANDVAMGWSPDGKYLLFASDRTGTMALFALEMQDGTPSAVPVALKPDMGFAAPLGVTSGGALFWVTLSGNRGGSIQLAQFDLESGAVSSPRDVSSSSQEDNTNPSWSADGKFLAYVSTRGRPGEPPTIIVRTADGGLVREIAPKLRGYVLSGWNHDSKTLLVVGQESSGRSGAFRLDFGTGEAAFLFATPNSPGLNLPTLSLDGQTLYYWNRTSGPREHVFVARHLASGAETELVRGPFLGTLLLSPDGRFLATETVDPSTNERVILLVPTDGAGPRALMRVADRGARLSPASWVSNSRSFIVRLQREPEGPSELWEVPIDGGSPRKLASGLEAHVFKFAISPDGGRVAYRIKEAEPALPMQIWKFEKFIPTRPALK
jgi:Tol biopolymer transport system component